MMENVHFVVEKNIYYKCVIKQNYYSLLKTQKKTLK